MPDTPAPALEVRGLNKWFGANHANDDVSLTVAAGTLHGIIGENGAGKSTFMNQIYGTLQPDHGEIRIDGVPRSIRSPREAIDAGIAMVHQHFMLVDRFTVLENLLLGAEGGVSLKRGRARARALLDRLRQEHGLDVPADAVVRTLPVGIRQRVEIAKALFRGARLLILDEPTSVLTPQETDQLFGILRRLIAGGGTVILITHKLREILAHTDQVTVMRAGRVVATRHTAETNADDLATLMVGRPVSLRVDRGQGHPGEPVLTAERLCVADDSGQPRLTDIDLTVHAGEIVGIAGVSGNGQSLLLEALAGIRPITGGRLVLNGTEVGARHRRLTPRRARQAAVAHVPEERLSVGLIGRFAARDNGILGHHDGPPYAGPVFQHHRRITAACVATMSGYDIRPPLPGLGMEHFSGGNQQKLVLAREIEHGPALLLVGQPTRGVDIGAVEFIHRRLIALRDQGKGLLLVSSELEEILALSDRILVMFDGRIIGALTAATADERTIGRLMAGAVPEVA